MTMLSDFSIRWRMGDGSLKIEPTPNDWQFQPASVDLTLAGDFLSPYMDQVDQRQKFYTIIPGECILACTAERVQIPPDLVARVEGKSSWGRKFLMVHSTAGFIDPGFCGQITLELKNLSKLSLSLPVGASIAQISFHQLDRPVLRPYGSPGLNSHYQNQTGVSASASPWS